MVTHTSSTRLMQNQPTRKVTVPPMKLARGAAAGLCRVKAVKTYVAIAARRPIANAVKISRILNKVSKGCERFGKQIFMFTHNRIETAGLLKT